MVYLNPRILKAKMIIASKFPFLSGDILQIPIEESLSKYPALVILENNRVILNSLRLHKLQKYIEKRYSIPDLKSEDYAYIIAQAGFSYGIGIGKRARGTYKALYYLAANLYGNEIIRTAFSRARISIRMYELLENYEIFEPILFPEIKTRDELLRKTIEDIYFILLKKLKKLQPLIKELILKIYKQKLTDKDLNKLKEGLKEFAYNYYYNKYLKLWMQQAPPEKAKTFANKEATERAIRFSEKFAEFLLNSIGQYLSEYQFIKSCKGRKTQTLLLVKNLSKIAENMKYAGTEIGGIEKEIEISPNQLLQDSLAQKILYLLSQTIKEQIIYDFHKPNRYTVVYSTFMNKFPVLPYLKRERITQAVIAIDTSGSIEDREYIRFVKVIYNLLRLANLRGEIVMWSSSVEKVIEVNKSNIIKVLNLLKLRKGYGGTRFSSIFEYLQSRKYDLQRTILIVFTDGEFAEKSLSEIPKIIKDIKKIILVTNHKVPRYLKKLSNVTILHVKD